jgi:phosphoserine phosphatase
MTPVSTSPRLVVYLMGVPALAPLPPFAAALATTSAQLVRLFQTRLDQGVVLGAVIDGCSLEEVEGTLQTFAQEHSLKLYIEPCLTCAAPPVNLARLCVTLLGALGTKAVGEITQRLVAAGFAVDEARSLGEHTLVGVELMASRSAALEPREQAALRSTLLGESSSLGIDVAVQLDDIYRRSRRLLCMDVDSTFVKGEFIDEMAELAGVKAEVAEITARAMRGELDFPGALRARVRLLRGLPMTRAKELCQKFELNPGAGELVRTVKRLGLRVGLVSGGFDFFVEMLKERYGLDFAFANQLEVRGGVLTGEVVGSIVDAPRKAQLLRDMAHVYSVKLEQTIAVGDGANDIQMLQAAGLGIAYQAKPKLKEVANLAFDHHTRLDTLLYLMGFDAVEASRALE